MHHLGYCKFNLLCSMLYAGLELLKRESFQLRSVQHCTAKLLSQGCPVLSLPLCPGAVHPRSLSPSLGVTHLESETACRNTIFGISLPLSHKLQPKHTKPFSLT